MRRAGGERLLQVARSSRRLCRSARSIATTSPAPSRPATRPPAKAAIATTSSPSSARADPLAKARCHRAFPGQHPIDAKAHPDPPTAPHARAPPSRCVGHQVRSSSRQYVPSSCRTVGVGPSREPAMRLVGSDVGTDDGSTRDRKRWQGVLACSRRTGAAETRAIPALSAQRRGEPRLASAVARLCAALPDRRAGMAGPGDARPIWRDDRQGHRRPHPHAQDQGVARGGAVGKAQTAGATRQPRRHARVVSVADRPRPGDVRGAGAARARFRAPADRHPDPERPRRLQSRVAADHRSIRATRRRDDRAGRPDGGRCEALFLFSLFGRLSRAHRAQSQGHRLRDGVRPSRSRTAATTSGRNSAPSIRRCACRFWSRRPATC